MKDRHALRVRAHAKINLYLNVVGKRSDGYHELQTVFHSIALHDDVIIRKRAAHGITVHCNHPDIPCNSRNLAYRAAQSVSDAVGGIEGIEINIDKHIPISAGLAGGSANAAAVLHGLNELFGLSIPQGELMYLAGRLGADVPFCLQGGAAWGSGVGDILTPLPALANIPILLLNSGTAVSTADVFKNLELHRDTKTSNFFLTNQRKDGIIIKTCLRKGEVGGIGANLYNRLELPVFSKYPEIRELKSELSTRVGCHGALMSGSGGTVFGLMNDIASAQQSKSYFKNSVNFCTITATSPVGVAVV